jgi:hypothetical protein
MVYEQARSPNSQPPGNKGIRRFVWEHFQNLNRVVTQMGYDLLREEVLLGRGFPNRIWHPQDYLKLD